MDDVIATETVRTSTTPVSMFETRMSAAQWNLTSHNLEDLPLDSNFAWLLCALTSAMAWIIYITYYNSRVVGFVLTKIINMWFMKHGFLKIGSFSVSVLSGKVMLRDVSYIDEDCSIRVQDGWLRFKWWKRYVKRSGNEDCSHSDGRLSLLLNGFEFHVYNRSRIYAQLERLLGLDPHIFPPDSEVYQDEKEDCEDSTSISTQEVQQSKSLWRDLIPVIKVDVSSGRLVFGNCLLPTTLLVNVEEAHLVYTTRPASNSVDPFTHIVKCRAENFKVILAPSPRYIGMEDEPPRFMGEGFVVFQTNLVDLYHYRDEPGLVPEEPEVVELADGVILNITTNPVWELEIKCGKGTDFSYGPWADRQRDHLFKFFFPQDYQPLQVTRVTQPGERRIFQSFDVRLSTLADATIDTLFSKDKETMAVHMNVKPGSYLEMTLPWVVSEHGYTTRINGQLLHLDASTSLQYRSLAESETLEFDVRVKYPIIWNDHQQYTCTFTGCKATANIIYEHKEFFQDLITDWASKSKPDLLHFVPYSWHFNLILKEFEVILVSNEHNWIDCSSQHQENCQLAFCGELFDMSINLPFDDFLPPTVPVKIWIQGECVDLLMFLPETNTSRNIVFAMSKNSKLTRRDGTDRREAHENEKKWRNKAVKSAGWVDCGTAPIAALSITYTYHPIPPVGPTETDFNITTPEKEELLLNPIRPPTGDGERCPPKIPMRPEAFNPIVLPPDVINLELEVGPSVLYVFGSILRNLMWIKENYLGVNQRFWDFDMTSKNNATKDCDAFDDLAHSYEFDSRLYRPLEVTVSVTMHDIHAHLMKNCSDDDPPCPSVYLERLGFELHKKYNETKLQLLLSPVVLRVTDIVQRSDGHQHLKDGHLALSGLQVRGHAMFSDEGLPLDEETIEYGWLVEVQFGHFTGRLTTPQLHHIVTCLETFVVLADDAENALQSPTSYKVCHHGIGQLSCPETKVDFFCPTSEDIKYRMTRLSVESVNMFLVESSTALSVQIRPIRFSTCNLHGRQTLSGLTALLHHFHVRQYVMTGHSVGAASAACGTNAQNGALPQDLWLEVGALKLGPVYLDSLRAQSHRDVHILQDSFLRVHDARSRRLWFLWPVERTPAVVAASSKCGCLGSCSFFGNNHNGLYFFRLGDQEGSDSAVCAGPGYGQSLLHEGQMVFEVFVPGGYGGGASSGEPPSQTLSPVPENQRFSFTRGYMQRCTMVASRDVSENSFSSVAQVGAANGDPESTFQLVCNTEVATTSTKSNATVPLAPTSTPPFHRTFSHPESQSITTPTTTTHTKCPSSPTIPLCSSNVVHFGSFPRKKSEPISADDKDKKRAVSVTSLQVNGVAPQKSLPGSPTNGGDKALRTPSRQSLHLVRQTSAAAARGIGRTPSVRSVRRATSIGGESVQSLDVYYAAEEELERGVTTAAGQINSDLVASCNNDATATVGSSQSLLQTVIEVAKAGSTDDRESNSVSSNSFISALSSQEDLALVDLHMQLNKPITESPLLMFAYNAHMTKLTCSRWYEPPPLPHNTPQSSDVPKQQQACWGSQWIPRFHPLSEGFTSVKITECDSQRRCRPPPPPSVSSSTSFSNPWEAMPCLLPDDFGPNEVIDEELLACDSNVSKHTMVIKFKGDVDVYFSPLMLETSQKFIESITPTLTALHPLTIVNHLHARCTSSVQLANLLKKEKYMYVSHLREFRKSMDSSGFSQQQASPTGSVYEEMHTSQIQAFVSVAKINLSILQASIVEEITSFSALDNLRDVTCVSLLILSIASLSGKVFMSTQSRKAIQTLQVGNPSSTQRRKGKETRFKKSKTDWYPPEPIAIETSETQQEEMVVSFDLQRIHSQLRRLKNSSSILRDAVLTVIPNQRSRVFFTFEKSARRRVPSPTPLVLDHDVSDTFGIYDPTAELEERMGFIMFECGMQGFSFKAVKRVGFEDGSPLIKNNPHSLASESTTIKEKPTVMAATPKSQANSNETSEELDNSRQSQSTNNAECGSSDGSAKNSIKQEQTGDTSSCVIDVSSVWFNFAAPPHMPNTQRIDFTRLDWHLLSTATPAINSWLNPSNRLLVAVHKLIQESNYREVAAVACLMAEALDAEGLHLPIRRKYNKLTPLAKTLREDPSCQLLTVLQRYVNIRYGNDPPLSLALSDLEQTLSSELSPKLETLHKGLVALGRQWKNVLYMPSLMERNIKMQKNPRPFSVSFALPIIDNTGTTEEEGEDVSGEEGEVADEKTLLLKSQLCDNYEKAAPNEVASTTSSTTSSLSYLGSRAEMTEADFSGSANSQSKPNKKKRLPSFQPRSSRASLAFPVFLTDSLESYSRRSGFNTPMYNVPQSALNRQIFLERRAKHHDSNLSLHSGSLSIVNSEIGTTLLSTPKRWLPPPSSTKQETEDLYNWMARQQDYHHQKGGGGLGDHEEQDQRHREAMLRKRGDSRGNTLGSEETKTSPSQFDVPQSSAFNLAPLVAQLADAHVIFQPLFTCLGVPSQIVGSNLGQIFGPNLAVRASLERFKIDIVESESRTPSKSQRAATATQTKFYINTNLETPAFQCERLAIEVDLREVQDLARTKADAVAPPSGQPTIIYATVGGFRKHNTVAVNFCINVHYLCQQVNLPLLRLLHQFSSMYQNARETQMELKESRPRYKTDGFRMHKKNDSSSGSESHTDGMKLPVSSVTGSPVAGEQSPASSIALKGHSSQHVGTILRRPQSLTQRFRASTKGYTNLLERTGSPLSINLSETVIDIGDMSCASEHALLVDQMKEKTPRCWRTMFYLLDLYATMPETKTVTNRSPVAPHDISVGYKGNGKYEPLREHRIDVDDPPNPSARRPTASNDRLRTFQKSLVVHERVSLVVFGVLKVQCTRLMATLSGLKLEAELTNLQLSHTRKEKVLGSGRKSTETSATGYLGRTMIVLLEGVLPNQQIIVKATGGKSQALYSGHSKRNKEKNSALITVGPINVDIPQHPVALHGMMTRSTKQLSSTLQELRAPRGLPRHVRTSDDVDGGSTRSPRPSLDISSTSRHKQPTAAAASTQQQKLLQPIVVHFSIIVDSLTIGASLLPSLKAQYHMGQLTSIGVTGSKAKFTIDLPKHSLSFATKVQMSDANLPSSASVDLPNVHLSAEYVQQSVGNATIDLHFVDGAVLRKGSYLSAVANLGAFEHSLTTDLLNHLVFVQKVFMKEINEVVQKMSGGDRPVRLWADDMKAASSSSPAQLLYSIQLRLKGIQITATTPTNSAVRFETGALELQLSNRVQNLSGSAGHNNNSVAKLFLKAHVELNVSLGQLHKHALFEEAEPEFQQVAYFKTRINLRNALQDEMMSSMADDKEAVLINLARPLIYIQPIALDKAVLVWLNYKNAYEYWNEQRASLNKEVLTATQQVLEKVPPIAQLGSHGLSTLFLQLTVHDMGICLPLSPYTSVFNISRQTCDSEPRAACVVTLESTRISACSSGSLVSKGRFSGLCIRFADDFETSLDDWKPDPNDANIMNLCVVSEGTYEFCSRTQVRQLPENAKWIMNVKWEMEGVAIHVDTNIGKQLSALAHTLTSLAGSQDSVVESEEDRTDGIRRSVQVSANRKGSVIADGLPDFVYDSSIDSKKRSRLIEKEMNEQAKIVNDLKFLGASQGTIEQETKRLHDLEALVFNDFRRDVIKRLRRQSMKQASSIKDKLGLSSKSRSKATALTTPAPTPEKMSPDAAAAIPSSRLSSQASSPSHGHARTTSLDSAHVTFSNDQNVCHYGMDLTLGEKWPSVGQMVDTNHLYGALTPLASANESRQTIGSVLSTPMTGESSPITTTTPSELTSDVDHNTDMNSTSSPSITVEEEDEEDPARFEVGSSPGAFSDRLGSRGGAALASKSLSEPNIDFELDVKVLINSGKCVLHTKDYREEELRAQKGMSRERSFSNSTFDFPMSPGHRKRGGGGGGAGCNIRSNASTAKLKFLPASQPSTMDFTLFLIPGLDVKVHYNSHIECGEMKTASSDDPGGGGGVTCPSSSCSASRRIGTKKASLFAWMTLQSIPEETAITPHILDFLEKALEPIPMPLLQPKGHTATAAADASDSDFENGTLTSSLVAPSAYAYASFPVDVIVYLRIQPSTLRFSCLPISRVECLLRLPSLDLIISTKRAEEDLNGEFRETNVDASSSGQDGSVLQTAVGGLSVTACLADFSVYIFHPYGGKKAGSSGSNKDLSNEASPLTGNSDRKDALSVQLEFVKVNISRSRKISVGLDGSRFSKTGRSMDQYSGAVIRFSTICDIGSASFKYDMRRLTEILAFPKAWYRRTIMRRLFLGDQSTVIVGSDQEMSPSSYDSSSSSESTSSKGDVFNFSSLSLSDANASGSNDPASAVSNDDTVVLRSRGTADRHDLTLDLPQTGVFKRRHVRTVSAPTSPLGDTKASSSSKNSKENSECRRPTSNIPTLKSGSAWETLVLFDVNLSKLNIHMNMGNVMGNTIWNTRELKSQGRFSIGSSGHKNMYVAVGLGGSSFDAKGGIVGGTIELSHVDTFIHIKEDPGQEPDHCIGVKLFALESRLDYMGTSVLMGRVSSLNVTLRDEWRVNSVLTAVASDLPTKRPALIFVHGELDWDQLQLMISKSTTNDLVKMYSKLEEFFAQQFHSSKRVLSSLQPSVQQQQGRRSTLLIRKGSSCKSSASRGSGQTPTGTRRPHTRSSVSDWKEPRHHRHWQEILSKASGLKLPMLLSPLPKHGTIFGGTMDLRGNNISLACFHGVNFRAKSWALFSLREPNISFATEAQDVVTNAETKKIDTHIIQNISFTLGHNITEHSRHIRMATVCRISRNFVFPPQFRSMQEWFHYAFVTSELDEVDRFPGLERERRDSISLDRQPRHSPKAQDCNHTMEMIFALPSLQLHLKTEHLQAECTPGPSDVKPVVECSFITEFEDHIFVTVDAEAFFFLHDLITAYIKEKDRVGTPAGHGHSSKVDKPSEITNEEADRKQKVSDATETLQKDWRSYQCKTWHLEPTVRLLSWAGKQIEPYGVDYILHKLGFSHARVTIPKWVQRGAMDPLDKLLSILMDKMVNALREGTEKKSNNEQNREQCGHV